MMSNSTDKRAFDINSSLRLVDRLQLHKITKSFLSTSIDPDNQDPTVVLDEIDFTITAGSIVGLVGRTGVGKTTFGRIITGLFRPDSGTVRLGNISLFDCRPHETRIIRQWLRYVPQNPDAVLPLNVSVAASLEEARSNTRLSSDECMKWSCLIEATTLYDKRWSTRMVGDLSLGQRRRIVNLRALQACPKFMVFDEPFNGLDFVSKQGMLDLLMKIAVEKQIGIMVISHDVEALKKICNAIWSLNNRKLALYTL